ncbi:HesA/MoeB/ThiF family protein [Vacuolonema iberomarrocanum]|uniref:HesA/MoeB/ThiF family protein n=1 Tax=Vacuolonema iberomarrocanum TaxID=3454632 RepID=UPI0019EB8E62|nr:ThiF family adenylyltransferase [filamentous cyanobacterium LEGE 07170]
MFLHEQLYRSPTAMETLKTLAITVCGAGALGANVTEGLARMGFGALTVLDRDRIEEHNLSTQPYQRSEIGSPKAKMLANSLYRAVGVAIAPIHKELNAQNARKLLKGSQLVIDTFDNAASRQVLKDWGDRTQTPCLHAGMAADYGEVIWNPHYRVPAGGGEDICDYPLARNLVMLTVAVTCEVATDFVLTGTQRNFSITLRDLAIHPLSF